jgi:hypothetical protein
MIKVDDDTCYICKDKNNIEDSVILKCCLKTCHTLCLVDYNRLLFEEEQTIIVCGLCRCVSALADYSEAEWDDIIIHADYYK